MKFTITGRNIAVTERLKAQVEKKLGKLSKFFTPDTTALVTLSVQKDMQTIEVTIPVKGSIIRAEESSTDMYVSIDLVEEIIERQIRRHRKKLIDKTQHAESFSSLFEEEESPEEEAEIKIVKIKKFDFKPMDPEEACLQMELLGHNFFVFKNAETDETCVVYKRKGDTYGLIEPEGWCSGCSNIKTDTVKLSVRFLFVLIYLRSSGSDKCSYLHWCPVIHAAYLYAGAFIGCMHYQSLSDIYTHMIDSSSGAIEHHISRHDLRCTFGPCHGGLGPAVPAGIYAEVLEYPHDKS